MEQEKKSKKSKIKIIAILLLIIMLILVALLVCYGYYINLNNNEERNIEDIFNKNNEAFLEFNETIEYGRELSYEELVNKLINIDNLKENTTIKIWLNDQEMIENTIYKFDTIGDQNVKILLCNNYEYKIINEKNRIIENIKELQLKVVDSKFPVITGVSNKEITVGDKINLLDGIYAQDEIDGELEVITTGNVDINKAGEYTIKVSATDKNGNVSEQEFKVTVKEKQVVPAKVNSTNSSNKTSNNTNNNTNTSNSTNTNSNVATKDSNTKDGRLQLAKQEAKKVVAKIITPGMSNYDKAYAIFKYLHNNVATQTNQSNEAYKTNYGNEAYAALILKKAACSGFCKAVTLLCNEAGLQSKHINANQWAHQWNTVLINGEWIILDAQGGIFGGTQHPLEY